MKENREVTDINVGDIEETLKKFSTSKRIKMYELLRIFKREGIENFVTTRKKYVDVILSDYKRVLKENEELKEYITIAPNLDEMTAIKYRNIQQEAYIQGRAEEQQKAEQIIHENYISKQKVKDKIEKLNDDFHAEELEDIMIGGNYTITELVQYVLQELIEESEKKNGKIFIK